MVSAEDLHAQGAPLSGVTVLVTRTREQAQALVEPLEERGAEVLAFPAIETLDPDEWNAVDDAIEALDTYDWVVLTSTNAVDRFFRRIEERGHEVDDVLAHPRLAVVGSATARYLRRLGIEPDVVPPAEFRAERLVLDLVAAGVGEGTRVLIPRAEEAREVLPEELRQRGAHVDVVTVYKLGPGTPPSDVLDRLAEGSIDIVAFASGGTARHFMGALERAGVDARQAVCRMKIASIGPVTTTALQSLGYEAHIEARESTMASLVDAIVEDVRGGVK